MSISQQLHPYSTVRDSRIISNQQTIVNQTEIVTPSNARFKRTVYHTPAIIQTVVDTPEVLPVGRGASIGPVVVSQKQQRNLHSYTTPLSHQNTHTNNIRQIDPNMAVRAYDSERSIGVKVRQNMSQFRSPKTAKLQSSKKSGTCSNIIGYCWGNRCPIWLCCLIPFIILVLLFLVSYLINRNRLFYDSNARINQLPSNSQNQSYGFSNRQNDFKQTMRSIQNQVIAPIVSTDSSSSTLQTTNIKNYENTSPLNSRRTIMPQQNLINFNYKSSNNVGTDIYNRVRALQNSQYVPKLSTNSRVSTSDDGLINQSPGISLLNKEGVKQIWNSKTSPGLDGVKMAPTLEQVQTRAMIESERRGRQTHQIIGPRVFHLRHKVY